jgi:hypothetical protein
MKIMDIMIDDSEISNSIISDVCFFCKQPNFGEIRKCKAFKEIPLEICEGKNNHCELYPGDNGIMFEAKE